MSKAYKMAKRYYELGLWTKDALKNLVSLGKLTEEEYEKIVGEKYGASTGNP